MNTILMHTDESLQVEANVLGSILIDPAKMDDVVGLIDEDDFMIPGHKLIWKGLKYLYQKGEHIDYVSLIELFRQTKRLDEIGGSAYIQQVYHSVPSAESVTFYANLMRSRSLRRKALEKLEQAKRLVEESELGDDEELLSRLENIVLDIRPDQSGTMKHIKEYEDDFFDHLDREEEQILTGFKSFDEWMGGIGRGWLYILAGRPSVGKTAKMLQMALGIAQSNAGHVLIWSQEMGTNALISRMLSNLANIPANAIRRKKLDESHKQRLKEAFEKLKKLPLHIEETKGVTIDQIKATARKFKRKYGKLGAIIVDYLTLMKIVQLPNQRWDQAIGVVTRNAKILAMEVDCPFIMLAQLNREGADKKPTLTNLRDSGAIEQDADVVEFLWKNPEDKDTPEGEIIESVIAKGRDIGTNEFKFLFKPWFQRYEELRT